MTYPKTSEDKNTVTSSLVDPIPVPTHGPGGSFAVLAKVHIASSPTSVLDAVRNTNTWATWNTFCPSCKIISTASSASTPETAGDGTGKSGWLEKGSAATIKYVMSGARDGSAGEQGILITILEPDFVSTDEARRKGCRIAWIGTGRSHWQLHSERVMEFVEDGNGGCDYVCWETFGGVLAAAVKLAVGAKLSDRFGDYARDLKGFVEGSSAAD